MLKKPTLKAFIWSVLLLSFLYETSAMTFFKRKVLFSEVAGVVLDHGQPVPGVLVERRVKHSRKEKIDTITTDSSGRFHFTAMAKPLSFPNLLPHETVITQRLILNIRDKKYKAWICMKHNYDNNGELEGKRIDLICDLKEEYKDNDSNFMGMCRLR